MNIIKLLLSFFFSGKNSNNMLSKVVSELLLNKDGGINNLFANFSKNGLDEILNSWIGTGENKTITANQLKNVFGDSKIQELTKMVGLSEGNLLGQLSKILPNVIDKLSPNGKVENDLLNPQVLSKLLNAIK